MTEDDCNSSKSCNHHNLHCGYPDCDWGRAKERQQITRSQKEQMISPHYYEAHVTIDPVFDQRLEFFKGIAHKFGFRVADLIMKKGSNDSGSPNKEDSFCTCRHVELDEIQYRTRNLVLYLRTSGFNVRRYKIEYTLIDSKARDSLDCLWTPEPLDAANP